jgi:hypothetical protein
MNSPSPLRFRLVRFPSRTSKKPSVGGESSLVYSFGMFRHTTTAPCIPSRLHGATMRVSRYGLLAPGWTQNKDPASAAFTQGHRFESTGNFQWAPLKSSDISDAVLQPGRHSLYSADKHMEACHGYEKNRYATQLRSAFRSGEGNVHPTDVAPHLLRLRTHSRRYKIFPRS